VLATTGEGARRWIEEICGIPPARLRVWGSPRFAAYEMLPHEIRDDAPLRVLFIAGLADEIGRLAVFAEQEPSLFEGIALVIRRYPHAWHAQQDAELARLAAAGVRYSLDAGSLADALRGVDLVLFVSTSAGIEAILRGRVVARVVGDLFDPDPFDDKDDARAVARCASAEDLRAVFAAVAGMDAAAYSALRDRQRAVAESIYAPWDAARLRGLLDDGMTTSRND
jgi:hypothetical protein